MKRLLLSVLCITSSMCLADTSSSLEQTKHIPWSQEIDPTFEQAQKESKPIYLYVSGSSWCLWCKKMDRELHNQDAFQQKLGNAFLFLHIDLAAGSAPDEKTKALLETYHIKGVPTVLILSPDGQELGRFRYKQIPAEEYAHIILETVTPTDDSTEA